MRRKRPSPPGGSWRRAWRRLRLSCTEEILALNAEEKTVTARRELEKGVETAQAQLPCLLTVEKTNYHPRIPNMKSWKASRTAEILRYNSQTIPGLDPAQIGDPGSPTKVPRTYPPEVSSKGVMIDAGSLEQSVAQLAGIIREVL